MVTNWATSRNIWVTKEFAEGYNLEWDILWKPYYYVHINDPKAEKVFAKIYYDSLSRWCKIKYLYSKLRSKQW